MKGRSLVIKAGDWGNSRTPVFVTEYQLFKDLRSRLYKNALPPWWRRRHQKEWQEPYWYSVDEHLLLWLCLFPLLDPRPKAFEWPQLKQLSSSFFFKEIQKCRWPKIKKNIILFPTFPSQFVHLAIDVFNFSFIKEKKI